MRQKVLTYLKISGMVEGPGSCLCVTSDPGDWHLKTTTIESEKLMNLIKHWPNFDLFDFFNCVKYGYCHLY